MKIRYAGYKIPRIHLPRVSIGSDDHDDDYERDSHYQIVEMEYKELMTEKADGSHHGIEKELTDLAAACICALRKMKSM